jgi:conjugal transfer pilus assembly protein TraB
VPSSNVAPYAAYGGASKAADVLSQYYVKRAEQYHPVIQVGAGNVVTIVFKDGFYLEPEEVHQTHKRPHAPPILRHRTQEYPQTEPSMDGANFNVPPEVLGRIDSTFNQNQNFAGARP